MTDPETLALLRDSIERYAADHGGPAHCQAAFDAACGYSEASWQHYAAMGWLALRLPVDHGGLDADAPAIAVLMEAAGRHLLMEPLLASTVLATGVLLRHADTALQRELLPALAEGRLTLACAEPALCSPPTGGPAVGASCEFSGGRLRGQATGVLHGDVAQRVIVFAGAVPVLVETGLASVQCNAYRLVDGRGAANLRFDATPAIALETHLDADAPALLHDEAAAALCAEALGVVRGLLAATLDYLKLRQQFGRPIGSFQALQHRAVEMFLVEQELAALNQAAQQAFARPAAERVRCLSAARAYGISAARRVANEAVQMHGGVGITEELGVSHHFRRLMVNAALFGSRDQHFERFVTATLDTV